MLEVAAGIFLGGIGLVIGLGLIAALIQLLDK